MYIWLYPEIDYKLQNSIISLSRLKQLLFEYFWSYIITMVKDTFFFFLHSSSYGLYRYCQEVILMHC